MHLDNYGNRAWCRLEVYVFSCLVEIQSRPISCFAYGLHTSVSTDDDITETTMKTGLVPRSRMLSCIGGGRHVSKERLVPLFGHASGAAFATIYLPSSGDLTVEDDRDVVRGIEEIIQTAYSTFAVKNEMDRLRGDRVAPLTSSSTSPVSSSSSPNAATSSAASSSKEFNKMSVSSSIMKKASSALLKSAESSRSVLGSRTGVAASTHSCVLNSKQIHDRDVGFLVKLLCELSVGQVRSVNLRDNMLTDAGLKTLLRDFITLDDAMGGRKVQSLELGGNAIGLPGAMLFERCLAGRSGQQCCGLEHLGLASTGLDPTGVIGVASWLGRAAQLKEVDLCGNGPFGAEAMEAVVVAMEAHGSVLVKVDDDARVGLSSDVVARFEQACRNNMTAAGMNTM